MAVTIAAVRARFPEFAQAPPDDPTIQAVLDEVELTTSDTFADQRDAVVLLRVARALALSPWGRDSRLKDQLVTLYDQRLAELVSANGVRLRSYG